MNIQTPVATHYGNWVAQYGATWKTQIEKLKDKHPGWNLEVRTPETDPTDVPILYCPKEVVIDLLRELKQGEDFGYTFLSDLTATDESESGFEHRFEVVYQLYAPKQTRLRVKVRVKENESVPTATALWPAANWAEREVWDMFGIRFEGHPDLRRILMDDRWVGHPLRKDYPLRGYQVFTEPMQADPKVLE